MEDDRAWRDEVPVGWHPLVDQLLKDLRSLDPTVNIYWAKEKFGELRVSVQDTPPGGDELIAAATRLSRRTCQLCGKPGKVTLKNGAYVAICPSHAARYGFS